MPHYFYCMIFISYYFKYLEYEHKLSLAEPNIVPPFYLVFLNVYFKILNNFNAVVEVTFYTVPYTVVSK